MKKSVKQMLEALNEKASDIGNDDEGQIVILERGSRVIELKAPHYEESAFWTNLAAIAEEQWNVGGDRTWISPELNYFVDDKGDYGIPAQLDPGTYQLDEANASQSAKTEQTLSLRNSSTAQNIHLNLHKQYSPIPNPLLRNYSEADSELLHVSYVGYECQTRLLALPNGTGHVNQSASKSWCNIWSITQVPMGGTVLIPTIGSSQPLVMFKQEDVIPMETNPHYLKLVYEGSNRFKVSLDALQSTGRFGYLRQINEEESSLLIRQFQVQPSGYYPDYPSSQPDYTGSCMQFFSDGGQMGGFGELEYHVPAIYCDGTLNVSTDLSQVYYFVGKTAAITKIVERMLGITL